MKILITGSRGFIGSHLSARLAALGHSIGGYDLRDGKDLANMSLLERAAENSDAVIHAAAQADLNTMAASVAEAKRGVETNLTATHNLAALCAEHKKWLIFASTICVYGSAPTGIEDASLPQPTEIYAASKLAAEQVIRGYGLSHGLNWTIVRCATVYGPGMRDALAISIFIRQALKGTPISIHGDGAQERTFTYIDDLVEGFVACINNRANATDKIFNISSNRALSVRRIVDDITRVTKSSSPVLHVAQRRGQIWQERISTTKAAERLRWQAATSWEEGLHKTIAWLEAQLRDS